MKIDNFFPEHIYDALVKTYQNPYLTYGWKAHKTNDAHGHWNQDFGGSHADNLADISHRLSGPTLLAWEWMKEEIIHFDKLIRCYINGHTYGVEGYFHKDSERSDETTIVVYLVDEWKPDWAGETVLLGQDGNIEESYLPKKNRALLFAGNRLHCARGVSRSFTGLRKTLMFKCRATRSDNFEKLSEYLVKKGALGFGHKKGTLHDHLVRVYQILETAGFSKDICFGGGLHSVFGTNVYNNSLIKPDDINALGEYFSDRAAALAIMFHSIDRPSTLETPLQLDESSALIRTRSNELMMVPLDAFDALRAIECANLLDQDSLDKDRYPNLHQFWIRKVINK